MALVCEAEGLLGHEVGNHCRCGRKRGGNIALLNVLATEMDPHVNMSSGRLVSRMERHSDSTFVVAEELSRTGLPKTEIAEKEAQVESLFVPSVSA